ncbi:glycine zipper 2TM domain-containing protein [Vibrio metschnikovii]|uniref:Glycine zipper 2TM domain-containing protein n=1 Tax=Vibrio metschnikovii TaxID=28172 RepID=A0A9X0RB93_VIBME|nr:glycine zipper 2TM domain-containing protein [Vibrio metschnikovii]MBC5852158.1 glycine zipper 2TM domain-containing protein [Vibrio metschnikovii]MDA3138298.1 glycine zipper 2TM domain-containing protein [Vibrio metschnikovii]
MTKWIWILLIFPLFANAAYQRNQARPVNDVVFGQVETVRYITQQEIIHSKSKGWETLLGAVVGGLVGHQFGDGRGKQVATAVGAAAGAGVAHHHGNKTHLIEYKLVELLIKTNDGQLIDVIQDLDNQMIFNRGDLVRILYFSDGVRVDKER